jgi:hypothetical protein
VSKAAFCRERGLSASAFHWWKGELARRDGARGSRSSGPSSPKGEEAKAKPAFVAVRLAEGAEVEAAELMLLLEGIDLAGSRRRERFVPRAAAAI